jgi:hypothetical protein
MMSTGLESVYADLHMEIKQIVPYATSYSFDDFSSHTCFHKPNSDRPRQIGAENQDLFYLFPATANRTQEHYIFGPICLGSHNSLFIDIHNQAVDKWQLVDRFPGLWEFFSSPLFKQVTAPHPTLFWHVPRAQHESALQDIKNTFLTKLSQVNLANWDYPLHQKIVAQWDQDDWVTAYKLSQGVCRSLDDKLKVIADDYLALLDVDTIDIKTHRCRQLRKAIQQQLLQDTLISKLLSGMTMTQDSRVESTQLTIINCVVELIDNVLQQTITQEIEHALQ